MTLKSNCPVHGAVSFNKRWPHDWAWWCVGHGRGETPYSPLDERPIVFDGECYYLIWLRDFKENPDGGDPRTWHDVMAEIDKIMKANELGRNHLRSADVGHRSSQDKLRRFH